MKILIFLLAITIPQIGGIMANGYQSSTQKKEASQAKMQDVKQDLNTAHKDSNEVAQKISTNEERNTFNMRDFELKIKENELRITELDVKIRKPSELFDPFYVQKIAILEKENRYLKSRVEAFKKRQSNMVEKTYILTTLSQ